MKMTKSSIPTFYHQAWLAQLGCQISATDHPMKISKSSIPVTFYPQAWLAGLGCQISATGHRAILIKSSSDSKNFSPQVWQPNTTHRTGTPPPPHFAKLIQQSQDRVCLSSRFNKLQWLTNGSGPTGN